MTIVSYAQNFEDVLLWRALQDVKKGRYVDIGAHDPVVDSVSLAFYNAGWRGIHVEPVPRYAARLREARPDEIVIEAAVTDDVGPIEFYEIGETGLSTGRADIAQHHCNDGWENRQIIVPCVRLAKIFEMSGEELHWLKIDVEGMESDVLRSWGDSPVRPWLVVVEATYPSTQRPTAELWIDEVLGRGYREVFFDGLSKYFLHEAHADLSVRFAAPPNVFDGFQVASTHFSVVALEQASQKELQRIATGAEQRESQLKSELAGVREELRALSTELGELESARALAMERLAASEHEHRATIDRAWRERHDSETSLRRGWAELEDKLRNQLAAAEIQLREGGAELAMLRERTSRQQHRIEEILQEAAQAAEKERQLSAAHAELVEQQTEKERSLEAERDNLARQLAARDATIAQANSVIRKALAEPLDRWQRLGRALALSRGDGAKRALRSWGTTSSQSASRTDAYMSFISPREKRNPYLRADSLSDLLSWNDVDFVRCAYVTILGRQPDPEGEAYYTDRIRRGYSKMHVLWQLRTSREGPHHDPGIAGLDRALKKARWGRSRVIGWLVRVFTGSEGDGQGIRRHREILNQLVMLSQNHQALADRMAGPLTSQAQPIDLGQEAPSPSQSFLREAEMRLSPKALNLYRRTLSI